MSADIHKYGLGPKVCLHPMCTVPNTVVTSCFGAVHRVLVLSCIGQGSTGDTRYLHALTGLEDCMGHQSWEELDPVMNGTRNLS